jgi:hypothetical protein
MVEWRNVAEGFASDGALRDIYIFDTSVHEWQAVYDVIRASYPLVLRRGGDLPANVRDLLNWEEVPTLTVDPENLDIACHFFDVEEIEFDLLPNRITSQADLDRVCQFLTVIGRAARKDAVLTMENCRDWVVLRYDVLSDSVVAGRPT